eukprot:6032685-Amphidinium_carterae.1
MRTKEARLMKIDSIERKDMRAFFVRCYARALLQASKSLGARIELVKPPWLQCSHWNAFPLLSLSIEV